MSRVGVFGLGGVADRIHLPACRSLGSVEVVGACDPATATRQHMAQKYHLENVYGDAGALLAEQKPEVVIIGTPPDSHHALCRLALENGAHVFCEKPFMMSLEEADDVIAQARSKGLGLAVNNQYRYMNVYRRTWERLQAGDFGRLFYVQVWQQMFHPPRHERVAWRAGLKRSTLFEFGTHALDLICFFFGDLPEALTAQMPRARREFDSDVLVQMSLRFPEERLATLSLNRVTHAPERYLEMRLDCERASLRLSLGGVACARLEWSKRLRRPAGRFSFLKGGEARAESGGRSLAYVKQWQTAFMPATATHLKRFLERIRQKPFDYRPIEHAREVLRLAFAGYEAAQSGQTVWLNRERQITRA